MLLAPYLTELLAEHVAAGAPPEMLRPFLPDRFSATTPAEGTEADYYDRYSRGGTAGSTGTSSVTAASSSGNTTSSPS